MKKTGFSLAVLIGAMSAPAMGQEAASTTGKIIMYRPSSIMGAGVACPIRYKDQEVVELGRGKYAEWNVAPGHYALSNKISTADFTVAAGQTIYVRCLIKPGMLAGGAHLKVVDDEAFTKHQADFTRKETEIPAPANVE